MLLISSAIPAIWITPATPQRTGLGPYSPILSAKLDQGDDGYRAMRLSLPPLATKCPCPFLCPAKRPPNKGLSRDAFESLLKVSRDQRAKLGTQKVSPDLRKESALKQLERTARFLAKVGNLPSCAATAAVPQVHRLSSSCGLVFKSSPLDHTEDNPADVVSVDPFRYGVWGIDEQGEQDPPIPRLPHTSPKLVSALPKKRGCIPPSLDEITARLKPAHQSSGQVDRRQSRLPIFLKASTLSSTCTGDRPQAVPFRSLALNDERFGITVGRQVVYPQRPDGCTLKLGTRHAIIPRAAHTITAPTVRANRADTTRGLIVTLSRRRPPGLGHHKYTLAQVSTEAKRRNSPVKLRHGVWVSFDNVPLSFRGLEINQRTGTGV